MKTLGRRDLIKRFGIVAFALTPVARAMGYVAGGAFTGAPRFVMFFKGGGYHSPSVRPGSMADLSATPLAPLVPHASDLIVFRNMHIHGGEPQTDGYQEEHGAGLFGCVTGQPIRYSRSDSYYAYTDYESIDITIANHYQTVPQLAALPFSSLHLGAGAHSDADDVGLGQRYISFRNRRAGDSQYGNAIEPIQNAGQVYDTLMTRINTICSMATGSPQPMTDNSQMRNALLRRRSVLDFRLQEIADAKRVLGMDSEHAHRFDGLIDGWREVERATTAQLDALDAGTTGGMVGAMAAACPTLGRPGGNGQSELNCDRLSPVHDQMIDLIKLAFEWDLTRVVAFTLSGASSGQRWPSAGVDSPHHSLEHGGDVDGLNTMGRYYSEKFARLLGKLKEIDDGDGRNGLYNSSIILGSECWSSGDHYLTNVPFVLAGNGGGAFQTGRIVDAGGRSNNDLLISVQNASGIASSTYGMPSLCRGPIV